MIFNDKSANFIISENRISYFQTIEKCSWCLKLKASLFDASPAHHVIIATSKRISCYRAFMLLKGYDKKGRRVLVFQMKQIDPTKHKYDDISKCYFMIMEILIDQLDQCSVTGFISGSNVEGATMAHVGFFSNPVQSKKQVTVLQDAYPIRPKAMHMMNLPSIMETVLNLFKSFMNDKMKARMQIGDFSTLQADAGIDVLPEELGGTNGKLQDHMGNSIV